MRSCSRSIAANDADESPYATCAALLSADCSAIISSRLSRGPVEAVDEEAVPVPADVVEVPDTVEDFAVVWGGTHRFAPFGGVHALFFGLFVVETVKGAVVQTTLEPLASPPNRPFG